MDLEEKYRKLNITLGLLEKIENDEKLCVEDNTTLVLLLGQLLKVDNRFLEHVVSFLFNDRKNVKYMLTSNINFEYKEDNGNSEYE